MEALFESMWPRLVGFFARRGVRDPENEASNTFLRVLKAKPAELTEQYVWRTARSVLVDAHRRASTRPVFCELKDVHSTADRSQRISDLIDLQEGLSKLTEKQRRAVTLHAVGYEMAEIGPTEDVAKHLAQRGRASLRRAMVA